MDDVITPQSNYYSNVVGKVQTYYSKILGSFPTITNSQKRKCWCNDNQSHEDGSRPNFWSVTYIKHTSENRQRPK